MALQWWIVLSLLCLAPVGIGSSRLPTVWLFAVPAIGLGVGTVIEAQTAGDTAYDMHGFGLVLFGIPSAVFLVLEFFGRSLRRGSGRSEPPHV